MGSLFSKPKLPEPPKPVAMPDPEDPSLVLAKKNALMAARGRSGRTSTMLSGDTAAPYQGSTLGVA